MIISHFCFFDSEILGYWFIIPLAFSIAFLIIFYETVTLDKYMKRENIKLIIYYDKYYASSGIPREVVFRLLKYISNYLFCGSSFLGECDRIYPGQLRPNDEFEIIRGENNYSYIFEKICELYSDSWSELRDIITYGELTLDEQRKIEIAFKNINTIDDYIKTIYCISSKYTDITTFRKHWRRKMHNLEDDN